MSTESYYYFHCQTTEEVAKVKALLQKYNEEEDIQTNGLIVRTSVNRDYVWLQPLAGSDIIVVETFDGSEKVQVYRLGPNLQTSISKSGDTGKKLVEALEGEDPLSEATLKELETTEEWSEIEQ